MEETLLYTAGQAVTVEGKRGVFTVVAGWHDSSHRCNVYSVTSEQTGVFLRAEHRLQDADEALAAYLDEIEHCEEEAGHAD